MAFFTDTQAPATGISGRFAHLIDELRDALARRKIMRATYNELATLSTRELDDLGINRTQIRSIAYEAAYGTR